MTFTLVLGLFELSEVECYSHNSVQKTKEKVHGAKNRLGKALWEWKTTLNLRRREKGEMCEFPRLSVVHTKKLKTSKNEMPRIPVLLQMQSTVK